MNTPTPHTDVDLRLPDEDKTKHSSEAAGNPLDALTWPVRTDRLTLRPATRDDLEATWRFRRLDDVSRWLTRAPATLVEYRTSFEDVASLAKTLIVELDGEVIGDLMLAVEDAWAQAEVARHGIRRCKPTSAGCCTPTMPATATPPRPSRALRLCFEDLGLRRVTANCFADKTASWRLMTASGCAARPTRSRSPCTGPGSGSTPWVTDCSPKSGPQPPPGRT